MSGAQGGIASLTECKAPKASPQPQSRERPKGAGNAYGGEYRLGKPNKHAPAHCAGALTYAFGYAR